MGARYILMCPKCYEPSELDAEDGWCNACNDYWDTDLDAITEEDAD